MDIVDRFWRGDIVFPDAKGFLRTVDARGFNEREGVTGPGGRTHNVSRIETSANQFRGSNGLNERFAAAAAKYKENIPVLMRDRIGHAAPRWSSPAVPWPILP